MLEEKSLKTQHLKTPLLQVTGRRPAPHRTTLIKLKIRQTLPQGWERVRQRPPVKQQQVKQVTFSVIMGILAISEFYHQFILYKIWYCSVSGLYVTVTENDFCPLLWTVLSLCFGLCYSRTCHTKQQVFRYGQFNINPTCPNQLYSFCDY